MNRHSVWAGPGRVSTGGRAPERVPDGTAEARGVDGRKAVELRLDHPEEAPGGSPLDQAPSDHLLNVTEVLLLATLDLGQRLGVEVVVEEGHLSLPFDEPAALLPAGELGDEVRRGGDLHVDPQRLLQAGDRLHEPIGVRDDEDV